MHIMLGCTCLALVLEQPPCQSRGCPHCRARLEGAGAAPTAQLRALHCLHTHLALARTQITLIHFKPTLSPEALQQILLKPYLHNVGRHTQGGQGTPGASSAISATQD